MNNNLKSVLKADSTNWLLEDNNPSVMYFTLRDILKKSDNDKELQIVRENIMKSGAVPAILSNQNSEGYWGSPQDFYKAKYRGTSWQLLILAELGADGSNSQIKKACEFIFHYSFDPQGGGFAFSYSPKTGEGRHSKVVPCLTGNMVFSFIRLGYLDDARVRQAIKWITSYQRFDDGIQEPLKGWPYDRLKTACFGKHTCHMGAAKVIKALSEIPEEKRSVDVKNTLEKGAEYFLKHRIYRKSHDFNLISKPGWLKFGFPLMYQTDTLEILNILTKLGYKDERVQEAVELVISKQDSQGRWLMENTYNGKFQVNIEHKGKPSKWITLNAIKVLNRFLSD